MYSINWLEMTKAFCELKLLSFSYFFLCNLSLISQKSRISDLDLLLSAK